MRQTNRSPATRGFVSALLRPRWSSGLLAGLLALAAVLALPDAAHAEPAIEVVEAGWDGAAVTGTWTPVRVRVTGGDEEMRVLVEVVAEVRYQPTPRSAPVRFPIGAYGQEVSLAPGASREVTLWFPAEGGPSARARIVADGETLAETDVPLQSARPGWPFIAVLAENPRLGRALAEVELPYQGLPLPVAVAELSPHDVPADAERLNAISALVVEGTAPSEMTDAQRQAVLAWVRDGGHLLVAGGPGAPHAASILPEGALPVAFAGDAPSVSMEALGGWLRDAEPLPEQAPATRFSIDGGEVLAGTPEGPLVWRSAVGLGTVTVLAFDPAIEPFASWGGGPALFREALAPALPQSPEMDGFPQGQVPGGSQLLASTTGMLPEDAHPGWPVVVGVLGAFALAAGPALYLVLRRLDRREWSWAVVPLGALGVSGVLYVGAVEFAGRDLVANVTSVIELGAEGEPAQQAVAAAFYGPTHERLSVPLPGDGSVRVVSGSPMYGAMVPYEVSGVSGLPDEPPFHLIEGNERRVDFTSGQYGARIVLFDRTLDDAPRVHAEIGLEDGLLVGTVRNDTTMLLEDATVVVGGNVARVGTLAPGQSAPISLEAVAPADPFGGEWPLSFQIFGEPLGSGSSSSGDAIVPRGARVPMTLPDDPEVRRRAQLLDQMLSYSDRFGWGANSLPLTFVAFTRASTVDESLLPGDHPTYQLTLLRQRLRLTLPPGPFTMPSGLIPSSIIETASPYGMGGGSDGTLFWIELRAGSMTYSFTPPLPGAARVESIDVTTQLVGEPTTAPGSGTGRGAPPPTRPGPGGFAVQPAAAGLFQVYDWGQARWEPLPEGETHRLEGGRYAGPGSEVRVRVQAGESEVVRFVQPSLSIEGTVGEEAAR